ncbi:MAG: AAA family ATPase [Megasphaera sp.]|jgi:pilus assembly protein CpaE|nr:AAA family ATPase [Megasphaera sp.]MCI1823516.1 AAA family ATPase [Megasphaera sp.]
MAEISRNGIIITVFSTASAVGKSLIAVNLTAELAHQGFRACVVDLDLQFGDIANFLQLQPVQTIYDAQLAIDKNPESFDLMTYITPYTYGETTFSVITAPKTLEQAYAVSAKQAGKVIRELRREYDYVIIDTTSSFTELNLEVMDISTLITAVAIVDFIPTIKNMKMGYEAMKRMGYAANKIRFILNRSNAKTNIEIGDVEHLLNASFYHVLPNDFKAAVESIHSAVPIVLDLTKKDSPLAAGLIALTDKYTNRMGKTQGTKTAALQQNGGGFFGLFHK